MIWPKNPLIGHIFFHVFCNIFVWKRCRMFWEIQHILPKYSRQLAAAVCFGVSDLNTGHSEVPPRHVYMTYQVGWNPQFVGKWVIIRLLGYYTVPETNRHSTWVLRGPLEVWSNPDSETTRDSEAFLISESGFQFPNQGATRKFGDEADLESIIFRGELAVSFREKTSLVLVANCSNCHEL